MRDGQDQREAYLLQIVGIGFTLEVLDVVLDLIGDAQRLAVLAEDVVRVVVRRAETRPQTQRHLEGRRGLLSEDIEHFDRRQRLGVPRPPQLAALPPAQRDVSLRRQRHHVRPAQLCEQAVSLAHQEVADVERHRHADIGVQRRTAVALRIGILDIVVDERRLVEALDRDRRLLDLFRQLWRILTMVALQRHIGAGRQIRAPPLAAVRQEAPRDLGCLIVLLDLAHDGVERARREPPPHLGLERVEVEAIGLVVGGQVNQVPHPVEVDRGVDTVVLQERYGRPRDGRGFHVREALLQHIDAADTHDRFDFPGLDHRPDNRRALGHQHGIAETLRFHGQVLNGTQTTFLAEQAKLIEGRRALLLHPQALRDEQQSPVIRNLGQRVSPGRVADENGGVVLVNGVEAGFSEDRLGMLLQLVHRQGRYRAHPGDILFRHPLQLDPSSLVVGNIRLSLSVGLAWHRVRQASSVSLVWGFPKMAVSRDFTNYS